MCDVAYAIVLLKTEGVKLVKMHVLNEAFVIALRTASITSLLIMILTGCGFHVCSSANGMAHNEAGFDDEVFTAPV